MGWLAWPVIVKRQWPRLDYKEKRAITHAEHQAILALEHNLERKAFYELCWHLGGSQSDIANLQADRCNALKMLIKNFWFARFDLDVGKRERNGGPS